MKTAIQGMIVTYVVEDMKHAFAFVTMTGTPHFGYKTPPLPLVVTQMANSVFCLDTGTWIKFRVAEKPPRTLTEYMVAVMKTTAFMPLIPQAERVSTESGVVIAYRSSVNGFYCGDKKHGT